MKQHFIDMLTEAKGKTVDEEALANAIVFGGVTAADRTKLVKKLEKHDPMKIPVDAIEKALDEIGLNDAKKKKFLKNLKG